MPVTIAFSLSYVRHANPSLSHEFRQGIALRMSEYARGEYLHRSGCLRFGLVAGVCCSSRNDQPVLDNNHRMHNTPDSHFEVWRLETQAGRWDQVGLGVELGDLEGLG